MALVDDADVQIHLPADKLQVEAVPDDLAKAKEDSERIIRGYLAGVVPSATLATWTTPANTPIEVRAIAGRLTAALLYRLRYSENSLDDPKYAQMKYNEAMKMIMDIVEGNMTIAGVAQNQVDDTYFAPNANTTPPFFTMDSRF